MREPGTGEMAVKVFSVPPVFLSRMMVPAGAESCARGDQAL